MSLTSNEAEIIKHSLGLNRGPNISRNFFCIEDGDPTLESLCQRGYMKHGSLINDERDRYYQVTEAGIDAVKEREP